MLGSVLLLGGPVGCRRAGSRPATQTKTSPQRPVEVPAQVTAYLGLRNPQSGLDDLLGIAREFAPIPFDRNGLLDLLAQRAHLPREILATIDTTATFWLVMLDGKQLGERDPGLVVFPLRSPQTFEAALDKRLKKAGSDGDLTRYVPRPGEVGLREVRLLISDRHLVVPSSRKVLDLCLPFVQRNLIPRPPRYDLALHLLVDHLAESPRQDLQRQLDSALTRLRSRVPGSGETSGLDREPVANATEAAIRHYSEVLKSTRELIVTADVDPSQVTLAVRAEGTPGGQLQKIVARQRPGPVFGRELLPRSSWLVLSNRSNSEAALERQKSWAAAIRGTFRKLGPDRAARFEVALTELSQRFTGDVTLALHRAPSGTGLTLTAVAAVKDAARTGQAMEELAKVTHEWMKEEMRKEQDPSLRNLKLARRPFSKDGARGGVFALPISYPEARREELIHLLGAEIGLGWAVKGESAIFTLGKEAEEQLALLADALGAGKVADGLAEAPAFRRAHNAAPTRIGMLYVSLLDLARWFEGSGIADAEAVASALKKTRVASAPSLDWGVNAARTQLDVTLHLPVEHFRAFKPILDELMKKRPGREPAGRP